MVVDGPSGHVAVAGNEAALDNVTVAALGGADTINTGVAFTGPIPVTVDGGEGSDTTTYSGTNADDAIGIARNGTAAVAVFTPTAQPVNNTGVEDLVVNGLGGADTITGQNGIGTLTHLTVDGGSGDDTIAGGDGADTLLGGTGDDLVDGNIGADTAQLGSGNDTFQWDPGDGSDTVDGQAGQDALAFNGSNAAENIDVAANGSRVRLTRNVAGITMDLDAIESTTIRALGSADNITVNDLAGHRPEGRQRRPLRHRRRRRRRRRQRHRQRRRQGRARPRQHGRRPGADHGPGGADHGRRQRGRPRHAARQHARRSRRRPGGARREHAHRAGRRPRRRPVGGHGGRRRMPRGGALPVCPSPSAQFTVPHRA